MLTMTENAVEAIRDLMVGESLPEWAGLRIAAKRDEENALEFSLASTASSGDRVVEKAGVRVFLEPEAAAILENKILDAELDAKGRRTFRLIGQQTAPQ
ncbi:HesB/IscA family protein [Sphaerimonospora mesophila]|uniref:HesB/IscA family protein n=1 Tax=Sphaerimonospora mesophila TaxID=37483 RepID=UPI0006E3107B